MVFLKGVGRNFIFSFSSFFLPSIHPPNPKDLFFWPLFLLLLLLLLPSNESFKCVWGNKRAASNAKEMTSTRRKEKPTALLWKQVFVLFFWHLCPLPPCKVERFFSFWVAYREERQENRRRATLTGKEWGGEKEETSTKWKGGSQKVLRGWTTWIFFFETPTSWYKGGRGGCR